MHTIRSSRHTCFSFVDYIFIFQHVINWTYGHQFAYKHILFSLTYKHTNTQTHTLESCFKNMWTKKHKKKIHNELIFSRFSNLFNFHFFRALIIWCCSHLRNSFRIYVVQIYNIHPVEVIVSWQVIFDFLY